MKNPLILISVVIFLYAILVLMLQKCDNKNQTIETIRKIDTIWIASKDTEHNLKTDSFPRPIYVTNNYNYEAAQGPIDTQQILRDYFTKRGYMDTIRNDSIDIILHEEVYKNELKRAKVSYKWKAPTMQIKETITNNIYPNTLHIGGVVSYYYKLPSLGLYGSYETKKMGFGLIIDPFAKGGSIIVSKRFNFKR